MAGRGPAPNPDARRRNLRPELGELGAPYSGPTPKMPYRRHPETGRRMAWSAATKEWWDVWCTSAEANRFTGPTWQRLRMLVPLAERAFAGDLEAIKEIRLQESLLGAMPADKLRLGLSAGKPAPEPPKRRSSSSSSKPKTEPPADDRRRRVLKLVADADDAAGADDDGDAEAG